MAAIVFASAFSSAQFSICSSEFAICNFPSLGPWDLLLLTLVSTQATLIAYLHQPRWKVLAASLPIPFTCASMALHAPIDVTHMAGLILILPFTNGVRLLHHNARLPIVAAIAIPAAAYCLIGAGLVRVLPRTDAAFWAAAAVALVVAVLFYFVSPHRDEAGHRSPLPLYVKLPIIAAVIGSLIVAKTELKGFMVLFPMIGVVTAYEARHSLWTVCRQIPAMMLALAPMVITVRLVQGRAGMGAASPAGWAVFLLILLPVSWRVLSRKTNGETL